jgi:hypothetical protein
MRRLLTALPALALALPAFAQSYGGGGVTVHQALIPWDVPDQFGPNVLGCVGGVGYGVRNGKRAGGEGHFCDGPYGNLAMGGAHFGFQSKRGGLWLTGYNTLGAGWVGVHGNDVGRFDGAFIYTRPSFGGGVAIGHWAGLEASAFLMLPLNVVGVVSGDIDPQFTFPHVGLQASVLFGDFSRKRKVEANDLPLAVPSASDEPPTPPRRPYPPPPPPLDGPPAQPDRQAPLQPGDLPPADQRGEPPPPPPSDDRPLAIPG